MAEGENIAAPDKTFRGIKLFWLVFAALNLVFLYYQVTFFIGNHDWDWVKGTTQVLRWDTGLFEGRYGKFILNSALFGGQVFPLLNTWLAFALLAAGTALLPAYWRLTVTSARLAAALLPALAPFILGWLYFPINILGNFAAVPLVVGGLMLAERRVFAAKTVAIVCFLLALGIYPSAVEMMFVCLAFRGILRLSGQKRELLPPLSSQPAANLPQQQSAPGSSQHQSASGLSPRQSFFASPHQSASDPLPWLSSLVLPLAVVIFSLILFKVLLALLAAVGILYTGHYNVQTAALPELFSRLLPTAELVWNQLWATLPFFPADLKICGFLLIITAAGVSAACAYDRCPVDRACYSVDREVNRIIGLRCPVRVLWQIALWLVALAATVLSAFLAAMPEEVAYMPRVNFYGLNFLYAGAAAVLLSGFRWQRNVGLVLAGLFLLLSVRQDFYAQKVWQLGKTAEERLVERVSAKIEAVRPHTAPLTPVVAGELPLRPRYYAEKYAVSAPYVLNAPFVVRHIPSGMFNFYAVSPLFYGGSQIFSLSPELRRFLENAASAWPAESSLFVDSEYAVILLTPAGAAAIRAQMPK